MADKTKMAYYGRTPDDHRQATITEEHLMKTCECCTGHGSCLAFCDYGPWTCDNFSPNRERQADFLATQWLQIINKYNSYRNANRVAKKLLFELPQFQPKKRVKKHSWKGY